MSTRGGNCCCWPLVMGTLLITLGGVNVLFGVASTLAAIEVADIAGQVNDNSDAIDIGRTFRKITGGLLSLGDSGMGAQAQELLKELPSPGLAGLLGVLRTGMALLAIGLGAAMCARWRRVLGPLQVWSLGATALGVVGMWAIGLPTANLVGGLGGWVVLCLDVALHIAWPIVVFTTIRAARRCGHSLS
ncbi:MAG: hypothetical protein MK101_04815 [Phycisphaerales bacterium]|nr:hypothetical protein [Phycisphaerales bacterium]